jgi:hypothetical protein
LFLLLYHVFGYTGHFGYDDLHYAQIAADLLNGHIDYNDHYVFRTPLIILTYISYSLFGINDFASAIPTIIITSLVLIIVYSVLKSKSINTLIIGMGLTTLSNWFIFYSDKLMPDLYVVLSVVLSLFVLYKYNFKSDKSRPFKYAFILSFVLLFGFMSKGTIILILPLLLYLFVADLIKKQNIRFWVFVAISGMLLLVLYFTVIGLLTGDALQRFKAISTNSYLNRCSYDQQSLIVLLKRIGYGFFQLSIKYSFATGIIFLLSYFFSVRSFKVFSLNNEFSFWFTSAVILYLSSNFMTISLASYSPMCLDPRHFLFVVPVAAIPAATLLSDYFDGRKHGFSIIGLSAVVSIISYYIAYDVFIKLYLFLSILLFVYYFIPSRFNVKMLFVFMLIIALAYQPYRMIMYGQKVSYFKQKEIFTEILLNQKDPSIVLTNDVQKRLGKYYALSENFNHIKFYNYEEFAIDSSADKQVLLFKNWYTRFLSNMRVEDLPFYAKNASDYNELIFENTDLNIRVYKMKQIIIPEKNGIMLFSTLNTFESDVKFWKKSNTSEKNKFAGSKSNMFNKYSASFSYSLDSLDFSKSKKFLISGKVYCNFQDRTRAKIVYTIEHEGNTLFWKSKPINPALKAYSNWWPVKFEQLVDSDDIKENSILKVYVWNPDKETAYIDNFEIKLIGIPDDN